MERKLEGKKYLITGGTSGIGKAISETLVGEGAVVIATHRDPHPKKQQRIDQFVKPLKEQGGMIETLVSDVAKEADRGQLVEHIKERYGAIDGVFNCAAVGLQAGLSFDYVDQVNHQAPLKLTRELLPQLNKGSLTALIPSMWSYYYNKGIYVPSEYETVGSTKHAGEVAFQQAAIALEQKGVRVGMLCGNGVEGTVAWKLLARALKDDAKKIEESAVGGILPTPETMAQGALRLLLNNYPSGHTEFVGIPVWEKDEIKTRLRVYDDMSLYVDRMVFYDDKTAFGYLRSREEHVKGHFIPEVGISVFPGHKMVEIGAQAVGLHYLHNNPGSEFIPLLSKGSGEWTSPVLLGDEMEIKTSLTDGSKREFSGEGVIRVIDEHAAKVSATCVLLRNQAIAKGYIDRIAKRRYISF